MPIERDQRDHYEVLGVPRDASMHEIRRAYRRLARQHHPDLNPGSERFAALASAYGILSDPTARARYDQAHPPPIPITRAPSRYPWPPAPTRADGRMTGVLELSAREADQLTHAPLTLTDPYGRIITQLPAGIGHGDRVAFRDRGRLIVLRVAVAERT